jgi:6-phosphogluconate dehydrogenase
MVHNAVEYGLMQAYAEGFALLRRKEEFGLDLLQICDLWRNGSVVRSWLLDLVSNVLKEDQSLEKIEPWVPDSGEGRWAVAEALEQETPVPVIAQAVFERLASRGQASFAHKLLAELRHQFGGHEVRLKGGKDEGNPEAARELLKTAGR